MEILHRCFWWELNRLPCPYAPFELAGLEDDRRRRRDDEGPPPAPGKRKVHFDVRIQDKVWDFEEYRLKWTTRRLHEKHEEEKAAFALQPPALADFGRLVSMPATPWVPSVDWSRVWDVLNNSSSIRSTLTALLTVAAAVVTMRVLAPSLAGTSAMNLLAVAHSERQVSSLLKRLGDGLKPEIPGLRRFSQLLEGFDLKWLKRAVQAGGGGGGGGRYTKQ